MATSFLRFTLISLLVFPFLSCGSGDGFNDDVQFQSFPQVPFIIKNDTKIGSGDNAVEIKAPWFVGGFIIKNNHPNFQLVVPSLALKYESTKGGIIQDGEFTLDADAACPLFDTPIRTLYATLNPGETSVGDADCNNVNDPTDVDDVNLIFFGGLPESDGTSYLVTVTLEGYMFDQTDLDDPIKGRVTKILTFSTQ